LVAGRYQGLGSDEIVIDSQLAKDLNVTVGERIRLSSSTGASVSLIIAGIYDSGRGRGSVYLTLRNGQSFLGYGTSVNSVYVKVSDIYDVDDLAATMMVLLPYEARPWTADFGSFLTQMQVMSASAYLISAFSLIASAFSIAAVLIVSVLQKSQQIGILKSMGARQNQILRIFVYEGLGVAVFGSGLGAAFGTLVVFLLGLLERAPTQIGKEPDQLFPVQILPNYIALAILAAIVTTVIASVLPARRAAKLNPVDVMR
jgi:lipoprotein-releasing system permease protein